MVPVPKRACVMVLSSSFFLLIGRFKELHRGLLRGLDRRSRCPRGLGRPADQERDPAGPFESQPGDSNGGPNGFRSRTRPEAGDGSGVGKSNGRHDAVSRWRASLVIRAPACAPADLPVSNREVLSVQACPRSAFSSNGFKPAFRHGPGLVRILRKTSGKGFTRGVRPGSRRRRRAPPRRPPSRGAPRFWQ